MRELRQQHGLRLAQAEFVFGYGSLAREGGGLPDREPSPDGFIADLHGFQRTFDVAMDNARDLPGYKYFLDAGTDDRPSLFVAFLNLAAAAGRSVNGVCLPVADGHWEPLGRRERNYERIEVTDAIRPEPPGRVWTYLGTAEARQRFEEACAGGRACVSRGYIEEVRRSFRALGRDELERFDRSTELPACQIRELQRVDLPGA